MKRVAVVDYGMGNVDSVLRGLEEAGATAVLTADPGDLREAQGIVLPGVGAFRAGIDAVKRRGLQHVLDEQVRGVGIPFLGVCLGMQLLATAGSEGGDVAGLGWIEGTVVRLDPGETRARVPHIGWNEVHAAQAHPLFAGIPDAADFYFVHSFHLSCDDPADVLATTPYCGAVTSAVARGNVYGVQFHPEKSQRFGLQLLRNFVTELC